MYSDYSALSLTDQSHNIKVPKSLSGFPKQKITLLEYYQLSEEYKVTSKAKQLVKMLSWTEQSSYLPMGGSAPM